jgi:hypothetical protein
MFPFALLLTPVGNGITLSGLSGVPYITEVGSASPGTNVTYVVGTDGILYEGASPIEAGVQWSDEQPTPSRAYWVRVSNFSGNGYTAGSADGSWQKCAGSGSSNITFTWVYTSGDIFGYAKVEIALDAAGSTIVATGYYGADIHAAV